MALTTTFLQNTVDNVDKSTYSFAAQYVGPAHPTRVVVAGVAICKSPASVQPTVTIGGVTATLITGTTHPTSGDPIDGTWLFWAPAPTGTTADVVVTSPSSGGVGLALWRVVGAWGTATGSSTTNDRGAPVSRTVTGVAGGAIICFIGTRPDGSETFTWTNATERVDVALNVSSNRYSAADATTVGTTTITAAVGASANFGPHYGTFAVAVLTPGPASAFWSVALG